MLELYFVYYDVLNYMMVDISCNYTINHLFVQ